MIVGAVLTGMVPYSELGVADPLAKALNSAGFTTVGWIVALGAIVSMSAVLLVFQYGQPRIFFAMGRDGLLPPWAAKVHAKTRVPHITTLITGVFVGLWSLIGDAGETYNLTNIGTLFAFVLVCVGVLVLRRTDRDRARAGCRVGAMDRGQRGGSRGPGVPAPALDDRDPARLHVDHAGSGRHR